MRLLATGLAVGSLLGPAAAQGHVYQQVPLRATDQVETWTSRPLPPRVVYLHLYDRRGNRELSQQTLTPCRARYSGFGVSAAVSASGCRDDPVPDDGRVRVRFVSVAGVRNLLLRITDSPEGGPG